MRKVLIFCFCFFSLNAFGNPNYSGSYSFSGDVELMVHINKERVWGDYRAGRERIQALRNQGYTCERVYRAWNLCRKFIKDSKIPSSLEREIDRTYRSMRLIFGVKRAEPTLISKGDAVEEWLYHQRLTVDLGHESITYEKFRVMHGQNITKIKSGEFGPAEYEFIDHQGSFGKIHQKTITTENVMDSYMTQIFLD